MSLTIDPKADRLGEHLAARSGAGKSEVMRVVRADQLRLCEASPANGTEPHSPREGVATGSGTGSAPP